MATIEMEAAREGERARIATRQPAVSLREVGAWLALVACADALIYRTHGFAGLAAFFALAIPLVWWGCARRAPRASAWLMAGMLAFVVARLLWLGSPLSVTVGFALLVGFALAASGAPPLVGKIVSATLGIVFCGGARLWTYLRGTRLVAQIARRRNYLAIVLPIAAVSAFATLFVLANPDLVSEAIRLATEFATWLEDRIRHCLDYIGEALFCLAAAWLASGLLRPVMGGLASFARQESRFARSAPAGAPSAYYHAARNTLAALILLFAIYLVFEFRTLWFREFPTGFHYSGHAHEGAAWLTIALALATVTLSLIFRGSVLGDPRVARLRRLAWVWWGLNLLLALAVYHRLFIYIDFNGMTRMRTIGLFGISTVVVGFALTLKKIAGTRDFAWLMRQQITALAVAVFIYSITPVDALAHWQNVRRVERGELPPVVQVAYQPIDAEGALQILPLADSNDERIREGVRAMLAAWDERLAPTDPEQERWSWTGYQGAGTELAKRLAARRSEWAQYQDPEQRREAIERFRAFAYQWY